MTNGLLVPLNPQQEVALRRIALRAPTVDAAMVSQLIRLALVERTGNDVRLTPLGQLRYQALPKAPLLTRRRSVHALASYVEGLVEKAQRCEIQVVPHAAEVEPLRDAMESPASVASTPEGPDHLIGEPEEVRLPSPRASAPSDEKRLPQSCRSKESVRPHVAEHPMSHADLCASSRQRIARSRLLLKQSVPIRPG